MPINFLPDYRYLGDRDLIEFQVTVEGKKKFSYVSLEEFNRRIGPATPATFKLEFLRLRPKLETLTREEIERKAKRDQ